MIRIECVNENTQANQIIKLNSVGFSELSNTEWELRYGRIAKNCIAFDGNGINLNDYTLRFYDPTPYSEDYVGYISENISDGNGDLTDDINITIEKNGAQINSGEKITIRFYRDYCSEILVKYISEDTTPIYEETLYPTQNIFSFVPVYFNEAASVKIYFVKTHTPNSFVRLEALFIGYINVFDKIRKPELLEEINILSTDLPMNKFECEVINEENFDFIEGQALHVYANNVYFGKFYVDEVEKINNLIYKISALDIVKILSESSFEGSKYVNALSMGNMFTSLPDNVIISNIDDLYIYTVKGGLAPTNWRYAMCACGWILDYMIDTSRQDTVTFVPIPYQLKSTITTADGRIIGNAKFTKTDKTTRALIRKISYKGYGDPVIFSVDCTPEEYMTYIFDKNVAPAKFISISGNAIVDNETAYSVTFKTSDSSVNIELSPYTLPETDYIINLSDGIAKEKVVEYREFSICSGFSFIKKKPITKYSQSKGRVNARIVLYDERVGDFIAIETAHDGVITGIITSIYITSFGYNIIADIEVLEWQIG